MMGVFRHARSRREAVVALISASAATKWERDYLQSLRVRRELWESVRDAIKPLREIKF